MIFYGVVRHIIGFSWRLWLKVTAEGEEHLPRRGPFLLLINHQSMLDPMLIHSLAPRQIWSMTKSTQFRHPVMRWLLARLGGFPTRRYQVDPQAVRVALRYLEEGRGVGIFPEGERSWDARLQPLRRGTVRLVLKAGVPVIPVGVIGAYDAWPRWSDFHWLRPFVRRAPVTIRYGAPLEFGAHDFREEREAVLDETMETLSRVLREISRP